MILNPKTKMLMLSTSFVLLVACKPPMGTTDKEPTTIPEASVPAVEPTPAEVMPTAMNNPDVINFQGFGPAKFGQDEESVRISWGRPLNTSEPSQGSTCFYLNPEVMPEAKRGIGFMFEDNKFVRYDVEDASLIAPGNFKVGDTAADIKAAFVDRIEQAPHNYIPKGFTLTVTPEDKSAARLIFEIGEDGKVANWRIGVPPQVFYVEGCS
ncbi:MAG: hypothetical protein LH618_04390 [Saprospiraceae bacterium]|nr:hypothetical protein [Saprospiraceae bacterium]